MKIRISICVYFFLSSLTIAFSQTKKNYKILTIAFYNLENLLDTIDNPNTKDEYSPILKMKENKSKAYWKKINNIAKVLSKIGTKTTKQSPAIIGVAEVENDNVLTDLLNTSSLKNKHYNFIHAESPDWRGIDVALLYKETVFEPSDYKTYTLKAWNAKGYRVKTRDQLLVSGYLDNELIYIIVNHWPSQRGGADKTAYLRKKSAELTLKIIAEIQQENTNAKIVIMGDFNDNPTAKSISEILKTQGKKGKLKATNLYNPFEEMHQRGLGTLGFRDTMNLFDQIIITANTVVKNKDYSTYSFYKAAIYNPQYLISNKGRYKGYPYRSWSNNTFTNGFSDHFPVFIYFIKEVKP